MKASLWGRAGGDAASGAASLVLRPRFGPWRGGGGVFQPVGDQFFHWCRTRPCMCAHLLFNCTHVLNNCTTLCISISHYFLCTIIRAKYFTPAAVVISSDQKSLLISYFNSLAASVYFITFRKNVFPHGNFQPNMNLGGSSDDTEGNVKQYVKKIKTKKTWIMG